MKTCDQIRQDVRNELRCPVEYLRHLTRCKIIKQLKMLFNSDNFERVHLDDVMGEVREEYKSWCSHTGLDPEADNRRRHPEHFFYEHLL